MKRYRLTKITVKTREIVLTAKNAEESPLAVCPVCHTPLRAAVLLPAPESSAAAAGIKEPAAELPPAKTGPDGG